MDVGMVLQLSSTGVQDPGETREVRPDEPLVFGEPFGSCRRGLEHGLVAKALMRAEKGAEGLGDSKGDQEVRPGKLLLQVALKPLRGFMLLTLGTVSIATGMIDPMALATDLALLINPTFGATVASIIIIF
jgi:hypothetical protein